mmetsp:Transcript_10424/g.18449  ORF Transcript_10424/g.18449 Transcript_10424/m.18449 type:complete len:575 (+) Transcript_10424:109-1833(+)|eukprot:CAMPEP_0202025338 /NCGR_PEP_ID=MMETSP0905-20130828/56252_1 /ASSEMBLY_ACC=CAM_ASM_000554 /TAXON_ID=420261 /ORGANISM="Thalassiosira antarctica, Strain CCMP982" /LENGTH=574 /DNA_ID=CAMNT_0048588225 /DNA_START=17 /DNA_END=1741 /DNA_ORIENTATION=+
MAAASKSSGGKTAAIAKTEHSTKKNQDPSPTPNSDAKSSAFGRVLLLVQIFIALITGAILGGYLSAHILESEYQNIVANLQSDHHSSLLHTQNDYIKCQSGLTAEQRYNEQEMTKLRIHADQNERAFQQRAEQYVNETNMAYKVANEGLERASSRVKMEAEKHEYTKQQLSDASSRLNTEAEEHKSTQLQLSEASSRWKMEVEKHESTMLQFNQVNKRVQAIRNTLTEQTRALEAAKNERKETDSQLQHLLSELDAAEEELDRRDIERAECDEHHREMLKCHDSLEEALANAVNAGTPASLVEEREAMKKTAAQLARVWEQKEELVQQVQWLTEEEGAKDALFAEIESKSKEAEYERGVWEMKARSIMEKITFRSRKDVLEKFGPGPYYVKLSLAFPSSPEHKTILLELAPLDSMPHTIHTFLTIIQKKLVTGGTFLLSREHILVGGPVDAHNIENNRELEERMMYEGYFPNGALLFKEYKPEYPHEQYTVGFNQVGGPIFYFNLKDNTDGHGSTYTKDEGYKEGEPCFGKVVDGFDVIQRLTEMPKGDGDSLESAVYIVDSHVVDTQHNELGM